MTSLFLGRFRLVFERIQNNGGRRLMHSGIAIIYLILLFKMSKSKSYPYYISIYILIKKCIAGMHCKSLWIKASAKCINVNVISLLLGGWLLPLGWN